MEEASRAISALGARSSSCAGGRQETVYCILLTFMDVLYTLSEDYE
jgi:hypothetical protein